MKKTQHTITRKYHVVIKHRAEQNKNQGKKESNSKGRNRENKRERER